MTIWSRDLVTAEKQIREIFLRNLSRPQENQWQSVSHLRGINKVEKREGLLHSLRSNHFLTGNSCSRLRKFHTSDRFDIEVALIQ